MINQKINLKKYKKMYKNKNKSHINNLINIRKMYKINKAKCRHKPTEK